MQKRAIILLAVALIFGGLSVFLVNMFLQREAGEGGRVQRIRTMSVVVAASDIKVGTKVDGLMLKVADWPASTLPEGYYTDPQALLANPPVALREIHKDEVVLAYKLSPQGARGGLPSLIPEDKRAVTIPVTETTGVAGFISPGDYVDVLHTSTVGRGDQIPATRVLLQNVPVIGTDQNSSDSDTGPKVVHTVTLLVDTDSGQKVALALATGTLSLLLRNDFDASLLATSDVTWHELNPSKAEEPAPMRVIKREHRTPRKMILTATPIPAVPQPQQPQVEMVRGLKVTQQQVTDQPTADKKHEKSDGVAR